MRSCFSHKHSPLGESKHSASGASFRRFAEKRLPEGKTNFERMDQY